MLRTGNKDWLEALDRLWPSPWKTCGIRESKKGEKRIVGENKNIQIGKPSLQSHRDIFEMRILDYNLKVQEKIEDMGRKVKNICMGKTLDKA